MFKLFQKKNDTVKELPNTKIVSTDYLKVIYPSEIAEMEVPPFNQSHWPDELIYKESLEHVQPLIEEYEHTGSIHTLEYNSYDDIERYRTERHELNKFNYSFMDRNNGISVEKMLSGQYRVLNNGRHRMYIAKKYNLKLLVHVTQEVKKCKCI